RNRPREAQRLPKRQAGAQGQDACEAIARKQPRAEICRGQATTGGHGEQNCQRPGGSEEKSGEPIGNMLSTDGVENFPGWRECLMREFQRTDHSVLLGNTQPPLLAYPTAKADRVGYPENSQPVRPTVCLSVTSGVAYTYGYGDDKIGPTRCALIA